MRKISYEVNPSKVFEQDGFKKLSLIEKGVYLELVNYAWKSDEQCKIIMDIPAISEVVGYPKSELLELIKKLIESSICYIEMGLIDLNDSLVFKDQEEQVFEFLNKKPCEIIDVNKVLSRKADSVSKRIVNCDKAAHPEIMYLKESDRDLSFYQGWMPSINFNTSGQVYVLPPSLLSSLADKYSNINLREHLCMIFNWKAMNADKRKPVGLIADFICRWCDRASLKSAVTDDGMSALLDKISAHL
ncbi:hypothetical protein [Psychromonas sp. SP041]|uniref:hypothetical protein n=1 Tax=Psychromonas sp. SP041 TaxID=1365007 RepID=UPI0004118578|nr:hypothetical protein [Psychromonas sp. SP041]